MNIVVLRVEESDQGILGVLLLDGEYFCCTIEPDNNDNEPCIPTGKYTCKRVVSPKFGDTFEITNVPGRTHILIHSGNTEKDTHGCILLGQYFGKLLGNRGVLNSGRTFKNFMRNMFGIDTFDIEIKRCA